MKRLLFSLFLLSITTSVLFAQEEEKPEEKKGFKLDNLFTGGGISLGFGSGYGSSSFSIGASPVLGYNITNWLDAGIAINYNYQSFRNYPYDGYKIRQSVYGGGGFVKIYPVSFLFAQAQYEYNFNTQKVIPGDGTSSYKIDFQTNSLLVGAGYAGRMPGFKEPFFYLSILFDVSGNPNTPYTNSAGNAIPVFRGGIQIPLFQGKNRNNYEEQPQQGSGGKKPRNYNRY
ncbi:MAG: hypothetical protein WDO19_08790 [Bacteroidota bacterium]